MSYELINKDLNMWSCSISDLTTEQVNYFLSQWPKGSNIDSLMIFYEPSEDKLVINEDMQRIEKYLYIIKAYMSLSHAEREEYRFYLSDKLSNEASKNSIYEFLEVLDGAIIARKIKNLSQILGKQSCQLDKVQEFKYIESKHKKESSNHWIMADAFNYGYMEGIRAERARRKAKRERQVKVNA